MQGRDFKETTFSGNSTLKTIPGILRYSLKYPFLFFTMIFFVILTSFSHNYSTYLKKIFIDDGILAKRPDIFLPDLVVFSLLFTGLAATFLVFFVCAGFLSERIQYDIREKMFSHMQKLPFSFFDRTGYSHT